MRRLFECGVEELLGFVSPLFEAKDARIDKIPGLDDSPKSEMKVFFRKRPDLEKRFDWNKLDSITWDGFSVLRDEAERKSKEKADKKAENRKKYEGEAEVDRAAKWIEDNHPRLIGVEKTLAGNPKTARDMAHDVVNYMPIIKSGENGATPYKFLLGACRIFYDEVENNQRDVKDKLAKLLKVLINDGHAEQYDENLNGMSFDEMERQFNTDVKASAEREREELASRKWVRNPNYRIVRIMDTEAAKPYVQYLNPDNKWCITQDQQFYDNYAGELGVFYFVLKNGFENVPREPGPNTPHDEYGESMMAVCVDGDGDFVNCTPRWNGAGDFYDPKQLSELLGGSFYELFPKLTPEEKIARLKPIPESKWSSFAKEANREFGAFPVYSSSGTSKSYRMVDGTPSKVKCAKVGDNGEMTMYDYSTGEISANFRIVKIEVGTIPGDCRRVVIPSGVTSIGASAFRDCDRLTSVTIPDSVTSIGNYAFYDCSGLTSVTIPDSVTSIGASAFRACSGLTSVMIPDSVMSIGNDAFYGCSGLTSVTIPDSVTSIGDWAFQNCSRLTSVTIPDSVTSIGKSAFSGCSSLTSVTIPGGVTSIRDNAFYGCGGLTSVMISKGVTSIWNRAFFDCSGLTSVTIPNTVTSIGPYAFACCSGLVSVTIPEGVTRICHYAFAACSSLTSVTIPASVTSIGDYAFTECGRLSSVVVKNPETKIAGTAFVGTKAQIVWESAGPFRLDMDDVFNAILLESKDRPIDRIPNLDDEKRGRMKAFFRRNPSLEKRFDWNSPAGIAWEDFERLEAEYPEPVDPATVPELSDPRDEGDGIVSYLVQDDRQGQAAMRRIIDTHWGDDANPWCLAARGPEGQERSEDANEWIDLNYDSLYGQLGLENLTVREQRKLLDGEYERRTGKPVMVPADRLRRAWQHWTQYSALPKRVAFKDGKLLAFMATEPSFTDDELDLYAGPEYRYHTEFENDPDGEGSMSFTEWMRERHPERLGVHEEWWDRNNKSHPNLDFAR